MSSINIMCSGYVRAGIKDNHLSLLGPQNIMFCLLALDPQKLEFLGGSINILDEHSCYRWAISYMEAHQVYANESLPKVRISQKSQENSKNEQTRTRESEEFKKKP
ncbi:hypothetical protein Tco_0522642 [Tanacetum coccineum]